MIEYLLNWLDKINVESARKKSNAREKDDTGQLSSRIRRQSDEIRDLSIRSAVPHWRARYSFVPRAPLLTGFATRRVSLCYSYNFLPLAGR